MTCFALPVDFVELGVFGHCSVCVVLYYVSYRCLSYYKWVFWVVGCDFAFSRVVGVRRVAGFFRRLCVCCSGFIGCRVVLS